MIGVVSLVGDGVLARLDGCEQRLGALDIGDVSTRQQEGARSAFLVDDGMDLGRAAAARSANGLVFGTRFLGAARRTIARSPPNCRSW